jgi:glutamyl/glutaminyl-tRNA synthetase
VRAVRIVHLPRECAGPCQPVVLYAMVSLIFLDALCPGACPESSTSRELELGRERRAAAREARRARGQYIGRPKALDQKNAALAQRMHASGESAGAIAATLGVSRRRSIVSWPNRLLKAIENMLRRRWTRDSRNSTRVFEFCSGLVDLVVGVGHHLCGGHRLTLIGMVAE